MISNYPEKLDKALLRPGRTDMILELGYIDKKSIVKMIQNFYKEDVRIIEDTINIEPNIPDKDFTPAAISNLCKIHPKVIQNELTISVVGFLAGPTLSI